MIENTSGIRPTEFNVLVLPDEAERKTKGGLLLADDTVDKNEFGRTEGLLVAVSPIAFDYAKWPEEAAKPKVGDRVIFSRYQAVEVSGRDGRKYWMLKDKGIMGVIEE